MADFETVLVTGGSGYVASYCIAQLLNEGACVRTTVRSLAREAEVRASVGKLADAGERLTFVAADLTHDAGWREACAGPPPYQWRADCSCRMAAWNAVSKAAGLL